MLISVIETAITGAIVGGTVVLVMVLLRAVRDFFKNPSTKKNLNNQSFPNNSQSQKNKSIIQNNPAVYGSDSIENREKSSYDMVSKEDHKSKDLLDKYQLAKTVIEYEADAADYWGKIHDCEVSLRTRFLTELDQDPQQNIAKLYDRIMEDYKAELTPYKDEATNRAYQEAGSISAEAKLEFKRVYELLGKKITPEELVTKIRNKFAPDPELKLYNGWENDLMEAERTGDISSMLSGLSRIGYSVNKEDQVIVRPTLGASPQLKITYTDALDLMTKVAFERKRLMRFS